MKPCNPRTTPSGSTIGDSAVPWTKGVQTDDGNFADFGVFAYYSPQGSYDAAASKPDYMYNVRVTRPAGGDWTYSPTKYWPQGKVSFFAYAPYGADAAVSVSCGTGAPRVTYAVPDAVADHRDLLLSAPALDRTKEGGRVPLTFRHWRPWSSKPASTARSPRDSRYA